MKSNGKLTKIYNLRGKLNFPIPEDGIDTSDATAVVEDIKQGKTVYARGQKLTGTMPNRGSVTISPNTVSQEHDSGYYDSIKVNAVTNEIDANIKSENIKDGISILGVEGNLVELNGQTITVAPSTTEKVINPEEGYNGITQVTVEAVTNNIDINIKQENIKKDVSILGITGTLEEGVDTSDANAAAANIEINKTAYVNGQKITGNIPLNNTTLIVDNAEISLDDENNKLEMNSTNSTKQIIDNNVNMKFNANYSDVATTIGLTPDKIKRGETILNVAGNVQEGIDTSNANALASDLAEGKTAYVNGLQITGTLHEDNGTLTQQAEEVTISEGDILQFKQVPIEDDFIARAGYSKILWARPENVTSTIGLTANKLVSGNTILGVEGTHICPPGLDTSDANAVETDILSGKTAYVDGSKITGTITSKEAQTYIPSSSEQIIDAGQYLSGTQTISAVPTEEKTITPSALNQEIMPTENKFLSKVIVSGDADLTAENVKSGVTIFGVEGSYTSDANAIASDILTGKTAYVNGQLVGGTISNMSDKTYYIYNSDQVSTKQHEFAGETDWITFNPNELARQNSGFIADRALVDEKTFNQSINVGYNAIAGKIGLTASKIVQGNTILGIEGTATTGIDTSDATATADDIVVNKTAYANGQKITGTIPTATTITEDGSVQLESDGRFRASATVPNDIYLHSDITPRMIWLNLTKSQVAETIGLTANKIVSGNTILDIAGTASIGVTPDTTIQNGEYGLETATSGELDNDIGIKLFTNANTQSKLYENGSIVEVHITNELLAQILGITADKIKSGETICGIEGTYTGDVESV